MTFGLLPRGSYALSMALCAVAVGAPAFAQTPAEGQIWAASTPLAGITAEAIVQLPTTPIAMPPSNRIGAVTSPAAVFSSPKVLAGSPPSSVADAKSRGEPRLTLPSSRLEKPPAIDTAARNVKSLPATAPSPRVLGEPQLRVQPDEKTEPTVALPTGALPILPKK